MLKDEQNRSYNGGVVASPLKIWSEFSSLLYVFIHKKPNTLPYAIFRENFEIGIYIYKKHDTLRYEKFLYKKPDTSKKARQFELRFLYTKSLTLCLRFFMEFLKLAEGGGIYTQNNALFVKFLCPKCNSNYLTFLYTKSHTLCVIFL